MSKDDKQMKTCHFVTEKSVCKCQYRIDLFSFLSLTLMCSTSSLVNLCASTGTVALPSSNRALRKKKPRETI